MLSLLKADLFRIFKGKLAKISLILAAAVPFLIVLLYLLLDLSVRYIDGEATGISMFTPLSIIKSSFSMSDNMGLVIPIFSAIFVSLDLSNGTLRNKVIAGHKRNAIYTSHLLSSIIFNAALILIYVSATAIFAFIFFKIGGPLSSEEIRSFLYSVFLGFASYLFMATFSTMIALVLGNAAPAIILTVVFSMILSLIPTVFMFMDYESYKYVLYLIPFFANGTSTISIPIDGLISGGLTDIMFIEGMLSFVIFGALHVFLGMLGFNKKDLK